ncbi:hypothetical protein BESB_033170 [Besnoitia besnoiti]|uniref:Transmembrane protein n=1 Tax=Besnoitia besnoiti TaxID=94643 RepID=A0A2A9M1C4_BESBE|nr:uncharacterized protein BESB_033170 [Besnoitia besnoiti]PFH31044.1 hypothetical protein BESB_033170 [Besnoitia besnoiti]
MQRLLVVGTHILQGKLAGELEAASVCSPRFWSGYFGASSVLAAPPAAPISRALSRFLPARLDVLAKMAWRPPPRGRSPPAVFFLACLVSLVSVSLALSSAAADSGSASSASRYFALPTHALSSTLSPSARKAAPVAALSPPPKWALSWPPGDSLALENAASARRRGKVFVELMDALEEPEAPRLKPDATAARHVKITPHGFTADGEPSHALQPLSGGLAVASTAGLSALQMEHIFTTVSKQDRKIIIKTLKSLTRRSFQKADNYITTHTYIARLTHTNPLFRSIARSDQEKQRLLTGLSRVVSSKPERDLKKRKAELFRVIALVRNYLKIPKAVPDTDAFLLECAVHLVEDIRQQRHEGYWVFFDGLRHDGTLALFSFVWGSFSEHRGGFDSIVVDQTGLIDTCAVASLQLGKLPVLDAFLLPGGFLGSVLGVIIKGFNYMYFPAIVAASSLISIAGGIICLTQLPKLLYKIYDTVATAVQKGVRLGFMKYFQHRVRGDQVAQKTLAYLAMNKGAMLLALMWQLKNVNYTSLQSFQEIMPTASEAVFQHGVSFGAVEFASELQQYLQQDYLALRPELDVCYGTQRLTPLVELKCDASWRSVEKFTTAVSGMLSYVSRFNFRSHVGDLLLLMYTIVIVNMNTASGPGQSATWAGFKDAKAYIDVEAAWGALPSRLFRLPFLKKNAHDISIGLTKLAIFFQLRRLHRWKPDPGKWTLVNPEPEAVQGAPSEASTDASTRLARSASLPLSSAPLSPSASSAGISTLAPSSFVALAEESEDLGIPSFAGATDVAAAEAVAEEDGRLVTIPFDVEAAAAGAQAASVRALSPNHQKKLNEMRRRRSGYMLRLLHQGMAPLAEAIEQLFGRFLHLLTLRNGGKPLNTCPDDPDLLAKAGVCPNNRALHAKDEMPLRLMVSTFAGMYYRRDVGNFGGAVPADIVRDFMAFFEEIKYERVAPGFFAKLRRKRPKWILDVVLNSIFGKGAHENTPITSDEMTRVQAIVESEVRALYHQVADSARFKYSRCDATGKVFILTDLNGGTHFFVTATARSPRLEEKACRIELQVQESSIVFRGDHDGGVLLLPGVPPIEGKLMKNEDMQTPAEEDSDVLLVVEATLWMKGYPRVHARMIGAILYVVKRLRYPSLSWIELIQALTPQDLELAYRILQEGSSQKLQADLLQLDKKTLYSFDFSVSNIWVILLGTLERAVMPLKRQALLSADFNIIVGASLVLELYNSISKNTSGLTLWYGRFENIVYNELKRVKSRGWNVATWASFADAGQPDAERRDAPPDASTLEAETTKQPSDGATSPREAPSLSEGATASEAENESRPVFSFQTDRVLDWQCRAFYDNVDLEANFKGAADIDRDERNALQCSLLQFMRRQPRPSEEDSEELRKESGKVLAYINRIVYELRVLKGKSAFSWKRFLNAFPSQPNNPVTELRDDMNKVKAALQRTSRKLKTTFRAWGHKLRSELGKKFFGRRPLNVMRGERFLRAMFVAFTELFPDPQSFPGRVLLNPMQMYQFCGLQTLLRTQTAPYLYDTKRGRGLSTQMKASPVPSDSHRNALAALDRRVERLLLADASFDKASAKRTLRQVGGYIRLLAETVFTRVEMPEHTARTFLRYVNRKMRVEKRDAKTETDFMVELQMQLTDLSLLHVITSAFDEVEELKKLQEELSLKDYNVAALSAEKFRLYSPAYYFGHSLGSTRSGHRPTSMLVATIECRQQLSHAGSRSAASSLPAFLQFLAQALTPQDVADILWADISSSQASDGASPEGTQERDPWSILMKTPLLAGLEILSHASDFHPDDVGKLFAPPAVVCHTAEPSAEFALPLNLSEWIKLRKDASVDAGFMFEARLEKAEESSLFDRGEGAAQHVSVSLEVPSTPRTEREEKIHNLVTTMDSPFLPEFSPGVNDKAVAGDVASFLQEEAEEEGAGDPEDAQKHDPGDGDAASAAAEPWITSSGKESDAGAILPLSASAEQVSGEASPKRQTGEGSVLAGENEVEALVLGGEGDETEPLLEGDSETAQEGDTGGGGPRRPFELSNLILPLFLDTFHGLYSLTRSSRALKKAFFQKMSKRFLADYQARTETGDAVREDASAAQSEGKANSMRSLERLFARVSGGISTPQISHNPLVSVVFNELYNNAAQTRKLTLAENVAKVSTWVCVNAAREICGSDSASMSAETETYRQCVSNIEARCRDPEWQEFQTVLQAEEKAILSGVFVSAMQSVPPAACRQMLNSIDDVLVDLVLEELQRHWWTPKELVGSASVREARRRQSSADADSVEKKWQFLKDRLSARVEVLRDVQPDLSVVTVRYPVEAFLFKLARGDFLSRENVKTYLQDMRFSIARAAAVQLDGTMVSKALTARQRMRNRGGRRRERAFYENIPEGPGDQKYLLLSDSGSNDAYEAVTGDGSFLQGESTAGADPAASSLEPAESPLSPFSSSSVREQKTNTRRGSDLPQSGFSQGEASGEPRTETLAMYGHVEGFPGTERPRAGGSGAWAELPFSVQPESGGESHEFGDAFGTRVNLSVLNEFTMQVTARREGRLKWMRPYRVNPALLVLEVLRSIRTGVRFKGHRDSKERQAHLRATRFSPLALMREDCANGRG